MLTTDDHLKILETCAIKGHDNVIIRALRYIDLGYPIMLYGPPGNGKTTIAEHLLTYIGGGKDTFYEIEGTEGMNKYHIIGGFHPLSMSGNSALAEQFVYKHGIVTRAIFDHKNLLIDELARAEFCILRSLYAALARETAA
ncbi:MAG: AAA family ATPase [Methanosarcinales archaeon]|nr:AAA family ATPase [Methanosarcinales archaeon]